MLITCNAALATSSQPLNPPPRTSSRDPTLTGDGNGTQQAVASSDIDEKQAGQTLGISGPAGVQSSTANDKTESLGKSSKRSLTNLRRRDRSTGSKQSAQPPTDSNEKDTSATGPASRLRPKKHTGFLSFLNCCAAPDETQEADQPETAQPVRTPPGTQPVRAQQPTQARPQQQDVSQANTSSDDSKEIVDEKAGQPPYQDVVAAEPVPQAPEVEKPPQGDATVDKPIPSLPVTAPPVPTNSEVKPLQENGPILQPEEPITGPPHLDTAAAAATAVAPREDPGLSQRPNLQLQTPTPVLTQSEDEMILDRTPEQAQRDNDIEMNDAGPSLPLSEHDAAIVVEEEKQANLRRESSNLQHDDLPGPPPLQNRLDQTGQDGTTQNQQSQDTSMVSTPEPTQKWLLPPLKPEFQGRKCLVLDLDETLVHSSFKVSLARFHDTFVTILT